MENTELNTSGSSPNYLSISTTTRDISFNEITLQDGNLSDMLKNYNVLIQDDFYLDDDPIISTEFIIQG